ncbi:MAG: hypothetical protein H8E66_34205 [Planctomycetes bacterium]|nr:hypothetical protein [Planctomycetota bacterium]
MNQAVETKRRLLELLAGIGILAYLVAFYLAPLDSTTDTPRWTFLFVWLLRPDDLVSEWVGNDASRFGILDRLPLVAATVGILAVAYLLGRIVLEALRLDRLLTKLETAVMATGVGANLLSLATLTAGLAGQLQNRSLFLGLGTLVIGLAGWRYKHWRASESPSITDDRSDRLTQVALACCVPFALLIALGSLVPPWHFDVREYHLQVPKEWYQHGTVGFMPHNVYGNMPLGAEMHAALGMTLLGDWWRGALVGKAIIATFAPLTALALFCFGKRFLTPTIGAVAAAAYLATPWTVRVSTVGLIEGPYGFYFVTAMYATLMAVHGSLENGGSEDGSTNQLRNRLRLATLAGLFAGGAVACKYPALLFIVAPLGLYVTLTPIRTIHWKSAGVFALAVACSCGPWLVKNYVLTGNPTYPLLYSVFGGESRSADKDAQWTRAHGTPQGGITARHAVNELKILTLTSKYISPVVVPLALIGLASRKRRSITWPLAALSMYIFVMWWLLTHRVDRFLFPLLPFAALLVGVGVASFSSKVWLRAMICLFIGVSVASFPFCGSRIVSDNRFFVSLSDLRQDLPNPNDPPELDEVRYSQIHSAHRYLNSAVQPGYRAMLVGEAQVFNIEVPVLYNTCFDDCVFETMMKGRSRGARLRALREQRISHVFIYWRELARYRSPGNYGYSDYITPDLVRREFIQQGILREIPLGLDPANSQFFEVADWQSWDAD